MNNTVIFLFIATAILVLSIISISVAPIINDILNNFTNWGKFNCRYYADQAKYSDSLDAKYKNEKIKNLCYRQNAMYNLEYSSFIIDLTVGFICAQFALFHYFNIGKSFEKITGLIGLIGGSIGFILTLVYVCFSGYIFTNDAAGKSPENQVGKVYKLYPNGALYKKGGIYIFSNDKSDDSQYAKYSELSGKQYNYNKQLFQAYYYSKNLGSDGTDICSETNKDSSCDYIYKAPYNNNENKYLYNRWCLSLVLSVFIIALNVVLLFFGFLIFTSSGNSGNAQPVKIR